MVRLVRVVRLGTMAAAVTLGLAVGALPVPSGASSHASKHHAPAPKMVQDAHSEFWECPARTTQVLVGVNHLTLHPGQELSINFIVRNLGTTACDFVAPSAGGTLGSAVNTSALVVGPCGSMGFEIEGTHHRDKWPGVVSFNCPAQGFAQVPPNGTVQGSGTWNQTEASGTKRFPSGHYTLVVNGHFSFPLQIDSH